MRVRAAREENRQLTGMTDAQFENRLSELLWGHREASREEIIARVDYLVDLEKTVALKGNKLEITRAFQEFMNKLEELSQP